MKKVILFDLYDTIVKDVSFSVQQSFQWLYEIYFKEVCTWEAFETHKEVYSPLYAKRTVDHSEVHFMRDEVIKIFEHFKVIFPEDLDDLEYCLMNQMQQETVLEDVKETLAALQANGIGMYILSNSIFSGKATKRLLEEFDVLKYFNKVFVSADYGIRKPHPGFFKMAVEVIQKDYPDVQMENILFVGNDYRTDVEGAVTAGLDTAWYNVAKELDEKGISTYSIESVFKTNYQEDTKITRLADKRHLLQQMVETDSCLSIGNKLYHFECESNTSNGIIAIRMFQ